jgi:hypothetical protein
MSINLYSSATVDSLLSAKLSVSSLSNAATATLNATAPTTGQALTYDGTDLVWATVGGGGGLFLPLAGGTMDASATIVLSDATYNSLVSGEVFGVELTADPTQNASLSFNAVTIQDGVGTMQLSATALTFPDATTQTTAAVPFNGGTVYSQISVTGSGGTVSMGDSIGFDLSGSTAGAGIKFADSTIQYTAAVAGYTADNAKADAVAALINYFPYYSSSVSFNSSSSIPVFITALGASWGIYEAATSTYYSVSYVSSNTAYFGGSWGGTGPFYVQVNGTNSFLSF